MIMSHHMGLINAARIPHVNLEYVTPNGRACTAGFTNAAPQLNLLDNPELEDLFDTRDVDGNEPEEPELSDTSLYEDFPIQTDTDIDMTDPGLEDSEDEITVLAVQKSPLAAKVRHILEEMDRTNLKFVDFLDGVSWGDQDCTQDAKIRSERTILLHNPKLQSVLHKWAVPPRMTGSKKKRAEGASPVIKAFSVDYICDKVRVEFAEAAAHLSSPASVDVQVETLTETSFSTMSSLLQTKTPLLWRLLHSLTGRTTDRDDHSRKKTETVVTTIISMLAYTRSHHRNRIQKLLSLYFKFKGVSAKGFDTLHAMALTMSHKWTSDAVERISNHCMRDVRSKMNLYPWLISYDNVNIPFRVFSQRLDNQGEFGNGTAATVYIKPDAEPFSTTANADLKKTRAQGMKCPLSSLDIMDLGQASYPRVEKFMVYQVLQYLLESPDFNMKTYTGRKHELLQPPSPIDPLLTGPEHAALQYLLGTVNIAEASYEDNARLVNEWFNQLGIKDPEQ
ncbi:hypothetical protein NLJ89_g10870 [Agrocybe chaxingu]|uniref:DUF6589 domain-containing protein n=1 Tax=Agrocybe chaxingu TaxID=84603 RepID=A0A9W8MRQ0_9AGAR|nr:hypothetical protein NLJ89_g10870 [Agrocybe chaxingu]